MNGKPGTNAELGALRHAIGLERASGCEPEAALLESLLAKLTAPFKPRPALPDIKAIEAALSPPIVPMVNAGEGWWGGLARKAAHVGATVEGAQEMQPWLKEQAWAYRMTVDRVLAGWPSYQARARAWLTARASGVADDAPRREFGG